MCFFPMVKKDHQNAEKVYSDLETDIVHFLILTLCSSAIYFFYNEGFLLNYSYFVSKTNCKMYLLHYSRSYMMNM